VRWREQDISRSMVALVASLGALALLGLVTHVPKWLGDDHGFQTVTPGLLTVQPDAKGVATLGGGVTVSMYADGMRVVRGESLLFQSVIGGSLLSAVEGHTTGTGTSTHEHVERRLDNMRVDTLVFLPGRATYVGELFDSHGSVPFTLRIELAGGVVKIGVNVNGADGVVWHLDHRPLTTGLPPGLPHVNLRGSARWLRPTTLEGQAAFSTNLGTDVGLGPQRVARGVDVRAPGRTDVHIWSDATFLSVSSQSRVGGSG
jgi:hypothetical protein